ncbi:zinc finger, C2H2 type [Trichinella nativa]|uniref:Zinc finger, C2H2 type n=1 Tax=Trichinella nativa TaxID=6335 RepID=A0A1Y3EGE5_9BILA|nr:zinc finger, C2H2 type [Trichinella nativa]
MLNVCHLTDNDDSDQCNSESSEKPSTATENGQNQNGTTGNAPASSQPQTNNNSTGDTATPPPVGDLKKHTPAPSLNCIHCSLSFNHRTELQAHMILQHGQLSNDHCQRIAISVDQRQRVQTDSPQLLNNFNPPCTTAATIYNITNGRQSSVAVGVDERSLDTEVDLDAERPTDGQSVDLPVNSSAVQNSTNLYPCLHCGQQFSHPEILYLHTVQLHGNNAVVEQHTSTASDLIDSISSELALKKAACSSSSTSAAAATVCKNTPPIASSSTISSTVDGKQVVTNQPVSQLDIKLSKLAQHHLKRIHELRQPRRLVDKLPFRCEYCAKRFRAERFLYAHKKKKHAYHMVTPLLSSCESPPPPPLASDAKSPSPSPNHFYTTQATAPAGSYVPTVPDMTCAMCRQLMVLFQSHFLTVHSNAMINQSSFYATDFATMGFLHQQQQILSSMGIGLDGVLLGNGGNLHQQVLDRDAYCEICQKEFCNKYFLKTHKLNMHGIFMDDYPMKQLKPADEASGMDVKRQRLDMLSTVTGVVDNMTASPVASQQQRYWNPAIADLAINGTLSCNLCVKSFPSFFALIAHRYRDHGSFDNTLVSPFVGRSPTMLLPNLSASAPVDTGAAAAAAAAAAAYASSLGTDLTAADGGNWFCEICRRDFPNKYCMRVHMYSVHGIVGDGCPAINLPTPTPSRSGSKDRSAGRGGVGNPSKNFCNICNKEVCNKYFLRTHMLKMHGIVIDENRAVIGSINTTTVENGGSAETSKSFVCRVCDRHFPGSHDLKLHYEEEHQRRNVLPPASEADGQAVVEEDGSNAATPASRDTLG